ncbi:MAG: phosphoribosylformylglycinamidine synthase I [Kouleothrix sp.]|jgi:phosphoribosylformylglycinamidine synthase|nr:phosphoribosylformylglycinamidine synthase I [Kouleothrix sp.]
MIPRVLVLRAPGINRDEDAAAAIELAGGRAERIHINRLVEGGVRLADYALLIIPGGFSYGDHLGAGKLLAVDLAHRLGAQLAAFVADGRPVIGICNGFQVLVKAGILPGLAAAEPNQELSSAHRPQVRGSRFAALGSQQATLADNASGRFECRWVYLCAEPASRCVFTVGFDRPIEVPVAHGEGRFVVRDAAALAALRARGQVALRYVAADGGPAGYPDNPNGSDDAIAGVCNPQGNVLGLMPHPEDAIVPQQHPRWTREPWRRAGDGLALFQNALRYAATI